MQFSLKDGRIKQATQLTSPNHDERLHPLYINTLVIHAISLPPQVYGGNYVESFFCNTLPVYEHPYFSSIVKTTVSSHFYIKRTGELIQFVATHHRAWHAGVSCFHGQEQVNDFSIGIELEGCDVDPFEQHQYDMLIKLSCCLMQNYPAITLERITGHHIIAPERKTDPGPHFNWQQYKLALECKLP